MRELWIAYNKAYTEFRVFKKQPYLNIEGYWTSKDGDNGYWIADSVALLILTSESLDKLVKTREPVRLFINSSSKCTMSELGEHDKEVFLDGMRTAFFEILDEKP